MCVRACACMHVHVCGDENRRLTSGLFLRHSTPYFLSQGLTSSLQPSVARLTERQALRIHCFYPDRPGDAGATPVLLQGCWETQAQVFMYSELFTSWANSPALYPSFEACNTGHFAGNFLLFLRSIGSVTYRVQGEHPKQRYDGLRCSNSVVYYQESS